MVATAVCRGKTIRKCNRQHKRGILGAGGHCEEFDSVLVHRAKMEETDFIDKMEVFDVVSWSSAAETGCRFIRTRWVTVNKGSDDAPQLRARWVAQEFCCRFGDKHEYFSETLDLAQVKAVIAHAARQAEGEDTVVAVFDVRRAHCCAEEKRDTFVELPDHVPAGFRSTHVGKLRNALYETRPAAASWGRELRKGLVSCNLLALCRVAATTTSCGPSRGRCMVMTFLLLVRVRTCQKWERHSRKDGRLAIR